MPKMAHASQSAARLLHRRYGDAIADATALPRMPACKCNSKPLVLMAVVSAPCVGRRQPTNQLDNYPSLSIPLIRELIFAMISLSMTIPQGKHRFSSCDMELLENVWIFYI